MRLLRRPPKAVLFSVRPTVAKACGGSLQGCAWTEGSTPPSTPDGVEMERQSLCVERGKGGGGGRGIDACRWA